MNDPRKVEIAQTDMMNWMERTLAACAPYQRAILAGVLAVLVLIVAYLILKENSQKQIASQWDQYYRDSQQPRDNQMGGDDNAERIKKLTASVAKLGSSPAGQMLKLELANLNLRAGIQERYTNKAAAAKKLEEANSLFEQLSRATLPGVMGEKVLLGWAQTAESLGDLALAEKKYSELAQNYPQGLYASLVAEKQKSLKSPDAQTFYAWFKTAEPITVQATPKNPFDNLGFPGLGTPGLNSPGLGTPGLGTPNLPGSGGPDLSNPFPDLKGPILPGNPGPLLPGLEPTAPGPSLTPPLESSQPKTDSPAPLPPESATPEKSPPTVPAPTEKSSGDASPATPSSAESTPAERESAKSTPVPAVPSETPPSADPNTPATPAGESSAVSPSTTSEK
ncbi:MAG: hypothetical protein SFX18_10510 [Pirellulales bacterium]|nr:hypothetical protein [Pirellulales bacterium]